MAEIQIKIFDTENGGIDLNAEFNPEYNPDHKTTPAQNFAGVVLQFISLEAEKIKRYYEDLNNGKEEGEPDKDSVD